MTSIRRLFIASLILLGTAACSAERLAAPFRPSVDQELLLAAKRGDAVAVWAALAAGSNPDHADDNGNTGLIFAARDGHLEVADMLIDYGAKVDWQDDEQVTPLILAASRNHPAIVTLSARSWRPSEPSRTNGAEPPSTMPNAAAPTTPSPPCSDSGMSASWTLGALSPNAAFRVERVCRLSAGLSDRRLPREKADPKLGSSQVKAVALPPPF